MEIAEATDADGEQIIELWKEVGLVRPWNDPRSDLRLAREHVGSQVLVGLAGRQVICSVLVGFDGHRGWLYYLAVRPAHQRQGLGRLMVHEAERWLTGRGAPKAQLMVRADNSHVAAFYRRLGYEPQDVLVLGRRLDGRITSDPAGSGPPCPG